MSDEKHYHGHRARLRERFQKAGTEGLADYEILELLLMQALPRRDVKPLAKQLIDHFGTLNKTLEASLKDIAAQPGMGETSATAIKLAHGIALTYRRGKTDKKHIEDRLDLLDYLYAKVSGLTHEEFHVVYLDSKNHIVGDDCLFKGTLNSSAVYPREVVKAALATGAASIVLVHNHPSGDPSPSPDDLALTADICGAAEPLDIQVYDHIIVGDGAHYSFRDHNQI